MKNALRVIAIVVAAAILFGIGFGIGSKQGINVKVTVEGSNSRPVNNGTVTPPANDNTTQNQQPANNDTTTENQQPANNDTTTENQQPANNDTTTENQQPANNDTTTEPQQPEEPATSGVPSTPAEIVAKYNEVINNAKHEQNVTIAKTSDVKLNCTDCSVGFLRPIINGALKALMSSSNNTYTVSGGYDPDGRTASDILQPGNRDVALKAEGVKSATCTPNGDGGYTMTIVIVEEKSTFDGQNTVNPTHHESCLSPLNLATLEIPIDGAAITAADMTYPGATLTVTVDANGKLTAYSIVLPMSGSGTGGIKKTELSLGIDGSMDESYTLTY